MDFFKKAFAFIFGTSDKIFFKIGIASFVTSIIFLLFSIIHKDDQNTYNIFVNATSFSFCIWIVLTKGSNSLLKFAQEFIRLLFFIFIFSFSISNCLILDYSKEENKVIYLILSCIGIFISSIYIVSKLNDIFIFFKQLFKYVYDKLYDSVPPATSKARTFVENITTFLVSIGGLFIAVKSIIDTISYIQKMI